MKKINRIFQIGCLFAFGLMFSCDEQEFGQLGETRDKIGPVAGVYSLKTLTQSEGLREFVVSDVADFSDFSLTMVVSAGIPATYEINSGLVPLNIEPTGSWDFDNRERPSAVIFNETDIITLDAPTLGFDNLLQLSFEPSCNGVVYSLILEKQ